MGEIDTFNIRKNFSNNFNNENINADHFNEIASVFLFPYTYSMFAFSSIKYYT